MDPLRVLLFSSLIFASTGARDVHVESGRNAHLQCQGPENAKLILLEWKRQDLLSDGYVFFYRDGKSFQHPMFKGRVKLRDPQMKNGNMSIILYNTTINDTGTYECSIITGDGSSCGAEIKNEVRLKVRPPGLQEMDVEPGGNVDLECHGPETGKLKLLQWKRDDLLSDGYVFFYRDDRPHRNFQHPLFKGRVKLRDPHMKNMDVSITLTNTSINDTGTYECHIIMEDTGDSSGAAPEIKHEIRLKVRPPGPAGVLRNDGGRKEEAGFSIGFNGLLMSLGISAVSFVILAIALMIPKKQKAKHNSFVMPSHYKQVTADEPD